MTNTGKALIIGLVLIDLGVVAYLLVPRDEKTTAANGPVAASSISAAAVGPRASDTHVVAGSVLSSEPLPASVPTADETALAPLPRKPAAHAVKSAGIRTPVETNPAAAQSVEQARGDLSRHGSNAVAAAMTQALVKESAKPDPSLPMPPGAMQSLPQSQSQSQPPAPDGQSPRGSNPVAAAMTQELVRRSTQVDSASQPPARTGAQ